MTQHTPLSLEFTTEGIDDGPGAVIVVEPSLQHAGRIFVSADPQQRRLGAHLLPDEARVVRDHLNKLLLDPQEATESGPTPQQVESIQSRIDRAVERLQKANRRKREKWFQFRVEFQLGDIQGVIGRLRD